MVGFYSVDPIDWILLVAPGAVIVAVNLIVGSISYLLVKHLRPVARALELLLQIGIGIFMCTVVPQAVTRAFGLREMAQHYFMGCLAAVNFFRYAEIAFDTAPRGVTHEYLPFIAFVSLPGGEVMFSQKDAKVVRCPPGTVARLAAGMAGSALLILFSVCALEVIKGRSARSLDLSDIPVAPYDMLRRLSVQQLAASYFTCCTFAGMLSLFMQMGAALFALVLGYDAEESMRAPMICSQGVNDFWGRRWNRVVHRFLKRLFFTPVLNATGVRWLATLAAFAASAAFHEFLVHHAMRCTEPALRPEVRARLGFQVAFFISQAILCYLERTADRLFPPLGRLARSLPYPLQVLCTAFVIAPFGPLFTAPLEAAGMSVSIARLFPSVAFVGA
mmetsp:Transcript_10401/g.26993  ORF Transcript_10401/g.26993 Transcript_10401/m.26993 type:complete len:389 (-) Transcript_10401:112-1278(-)